MFWGVIGRLYPRKSGKYIKRLFTALFFFLTWFLIGHTKSLTNNIDTTAVTGSSIGKFQEVFVLKFPETLHWQVAWNTVSKPMNLQLMLQVQWGRMKTSLVTIVFGLVLETIDQIRVAAFAHSKPLHMIRIHPVFVQNTNRFQQRPPHIRSQFYIHTLQTSFLPIIFNCTFF